MIVTAIQVAQIVAPLVQRPGHQLVRLQFSDGTSTNYCIKCSYGRASRGCNGGRVSIPAIGEKVDLSGNRWTESDGKTVVGMIVVGTVGGGFNS